MDIWKQKVVTFSALMLVTFSALMLCDSHTFQRQEEKYDERKNIYFAMHILGMHNALEFQITLLSVK